MFSDARLPSFHSPAEPNDNGGNLGMPGVSFAIVCMRLQELLNEMKQERDA